ncbi:unnamed protein product [Clavelina lepadiformis]|uniref:Zinc finger GAGA-binding factor domain-containing protein n=1 Tax=Clavelina lepadiformis TaxID=159417 RepID=A0ABP0FW56_CLALP
MKSLLSALNCTNTEKQSHFHCCMCPAVITRSFNFKRHLELCSTAGKRLFSGDDKVSDDATCTKLLKKSTSIWKWLILCVM